MYQGLLQHDAVLVYSFQKVVLKYLQIKLPFNIKVIYFSDECAGQYKNYKNFLNLMNHRDDFRLDAGWKSFVTSPGKNECDNVGRNVKRLAAHAGLHWPKDKQTLTPRQLYEFSRTEITGLT